MCTGDKLGSADLGQTTRDDNIGFLIYDFFWCAGSVRYLKVGKVVYLCTPYASSSFKGWAGGGLALKSFWAPNLKFDQYLIVRV